MPPRLALALALVMLVLPSGAGALSPQEDWARHGFQHGAWDCFGSCPNGRGARPSGTPASTRITLACQRNLDDGRTLFSDGRLIPDGARTRIVSYTPNRREIGWSYGTCVVDVIR